MSVTICGKSYPLDTKILYLSDKRLTKFPEEIQYLTQLQEINLRNNKITKIPKEITYLTQLQILYLTSNKITEIPKEIQYLAQLQILDVSYNQITEIPTEIQYLTQLQELYLEQNKITEIPKEIQYLTQLQIFYLHYNKITKIPQDIQYLTQLQALHLSTNQITEIPLEIINLKNLQYFSHNNNPIENLNNPVIRRFFDRIRNRGGNIHNLYNDGQNVHSSSIQQSIKQSIINLIKEIKEPLNYDYLSDPLFAVATKEALTEYCNDPSVHSGLECAFSDVLDAVLLEMSKFTPELQIEIKKRINEEMADAECKCFTGRLSRIVNSLSGYSDKVTIKISSAEEIGNIIILMKSKYKLLDDVKNNIQEEMKGRGYSDEIIEEWISYI